MIMKFLIVAVVLYGIYLFLFRKKPTPAPKSGRKTHFSKDTQTMVECTKCSTFVSVNEAIIKDGKFYCSNECARS